MLLDRDGTLNVQVVDDYVREPGGLRLLPGAAAAVGRLRAAGCRVVVVTNQRGVSRGLMTLADGRQPAVKRSNPLLGLRFRYAVTDPARTERITDPFRILFRPFVTIPVMAAFLAVCWWVLFEKGLASATYEAFEHPGLLLLVFAATVLGGLGTIWGAMVGALLIGTFVEVSTLFIPSELKYVGALVILIAVLLVRPQGLLGRAERVG